MVENLDLEALDLMSYLSFISVYMHVKVIFDYAILCIHELCQGMLEYTDFGWWQARDEGSAVTLTPEGGGI